MLLSRFVTLSDRAVDSMSQSSSPPETPGQPIPQATATAEAGNDPTLTTAEAKPSYVKLAMRNMVRKRGKALFHFALTTVGLLGLLVGLAYLTR